GRNARHLPVRAAARGERRRDRALSAGLARVKPLSPSKLFQKYLRFWRGFRALNGCFAPITGKKDHLPPRWAWLCRCPEEKMPGRARVGIAPGTTADRHPCRSAARIAI